MYKNYQSFVVFFLILITPGLALALDGHGRPIANTVMYPTFTCGCHAGHIDGYYLNSTLAAAACDAARGSSVRFALNATVPNLGGCYYPRDIFRFGTNTFYSQSGTYGWHGYYYQVDVSGCATYHMFLYDNGYINPPNTTAPLTMDYLIDTDGDGLPDSVDAWPTIDNTNDTVRRVGYCTDDGGNVIGETYQSEEHGIFTVGDASNCAHPYIQIGGSNTWDQVVSDIMDWYAPWDENSDGGDNQTIGPINEVPEVPDWEIGQTSDGATDDSELLRRIVDNTAASNANIESTRTLQNNLAQNIKAMVDVIGVLRPPSAIEIGNAVGNAIGEGGGEYGGPSAADIGTAVDTGIDDEGIKSAIEAVGTGITGMGDALDGIGLGIDDIGTGIEGLPGLIGDEVLDGEPGGALDGIDADTTVDQKVADVQSGTVFGDGTINYEGLDPLSEIQESTYLEDALDTLFELNPMQAVIDDISLTASGSCSQTISLLGRDVVFGFCDWSGFLQTWGSIMMALTTIGSIVWVVRG